MKHVFIFTWPYQERMLGTVMHHISFMICSLIVWPNTPAQITCCNRWKTHWCHTHSLQVRPTLSLGPFEYVMMSLYRDTQINIWVNTQFKKPRQIKFCYMYISLACLNRKPHTAYTSTRNGRTERIVSRAPSTTSWTEEGAVSFRCLPWGGRKNCCSY